MVKLNPNSTYYKDLTHLTSQGFNFDSIYNTKWSKTDSKNWDLTCKGKVVASFEFTYIKRLIDKKVLITQFYDKF